MKTKKRRYLHLTCKAWTQNRWMLQRSSLHQTCIHGLDWDEKPKTEVNNDDIFLVKFKYEIKHIKLFRISRTNNDANHQRNRSSFE